MAGKACSERSRYLSVTAGKHPPQVITVSLAGSGLRFLSEVDLGVTAL